MTSSWPFSKPRFADFFLPNVLENIRWRENLNELRQVGWLCVRPRKNTNVLDGDYRGLGHIAVFDHFSIHFKMQWKLDVQIILTNACCRYTIYIDSPVWSDYFLFGCQIFRWELSCKRSDNPSKFKPKRTNVCENASAAHRTLPIYK